MGTKWTDQHPWAPEGAIAALRERPPVEGTRMEAPRWSPSAGAPLTEAEENILSHFAGRCHDGSNCPACDSMHKYMDALVEARKRAETAETWISELVEGA